MNADGGPEAAVLLARAAGGDAEAWGALLTRHQERLQCVLAFRLDPRLRGRVDAADVIQEAFIVATARRADFFGQSAQPLFLWLRWIVGNTLLELHRHHRAALPVFQLRAGKQRVDAQGVLGVLGVRRFRHELSWSATRVQSVFTAVAGRSAARSDQASRHLVG